jgi:hypothetical protein
MTKDAERRDKQGSMQRGETSKAACREERQARQHAERRDKQGSMQRRDRRCGSDMTQHAQENTRTPQTSTQPYQHRKKRDTTCNTCELLN